MGGMSAEAARSGYDGSNFSSGGGFGGGFSGGGGGRRRRRPEWAEDKKVATFMWLLLKIKGDVLLICSQ